MLNCFLIRIRIFRARSIYVCIMVYAYIYIYVYTKLRNLRVSEVVKSALQEGKSRQSLASYYSCGLSEKKILENKKTPNDLLELIYTDG